MLAVANCSIPIISEPKAVEPPWPVDRLAFELDEEDLDAEILHVLSSVKELMSKYRMYSKTKESQGGVWGLAAVHHQQAEEAGDKREKLDATFEGTVSAGRESAVLFGNGSGGQPVRV
ncbi:hypothetical protein BaRGS_00021235 [Batillaria attramentaria]|uniref:Uncharacterized protein n=1 Tax=Batillaria attramentaria TaxID=370345 RepID=A0ABD0KKH7_9CAEN